MLNNTFKTVFKVSIPLLLLSALVFVSVKNDDSYDANSVMAELKKTATASLLENRIEQAINNEQIDDAVMYHHLANWLEIPLSTQLVAKLQAEDSLLQRTWRFGKNAAQGFVKGDADNAAGIAGSIAADLTPYGDVRDFSIQSMRYFNGGTVDKFVYGLAAIGLATTAAVYLSAGAAEPIDVGVSVLKTAKKTGNISSDLVKEFGKGVEETLDLQILKKRLSTIDLANPVRSAEAIKEAAVSAVKKDKLLKLGNELAEIKKIHNATGSISDTVKLMKYADSIDDVKRIGRLAGNFKGQTRAILAVLGKNALRLTRFAAVQFISFALMIASLLISLISFVMGLLSAGMGIVSSTLALFRKHR